MTPMRIGECVTVTDRGKDETCHEMIYVDLSAKSKRSGSYSLKLTSS
jgi:hypothetical protein